MSGDLAQMTPEKREAMFLRKMLESFERIANRVDQQDEKIEVLTSVVENDVFITCRQAAMVQNTVAQRVRTFLAECGLDYNQNSKRMFSAVWRDLKNEMGVPSYREIPRKKFGTAVKFVVEWVPTELPATKAG
jgi:division protein CdvB (Snf7/Vps24/ESCRT-III family)